MIPTSLVDIHALLPAFIDKFAIAQTDVYIEQRRRPKADDPEKTELTLTEVKYQLSKERLIEHFTANKLIARRTRSGEVYKAGSVSIKPLLNTGCIRWFCIDCDRIDAVDLLFTKIKPVLDEFGIDYVIEWSSRKEKAHCWIFCEEISASIATLFTDWLVDKAKCKDFRRKKVSIEFFGGFKQKSAIRLPGGIHAKDELRHPVILQDGTESNDPVQIMKRIISCQPITAFRITELVRSVRKKAPRIGQLIHRLQTVGSTFDTIGESESDQHTFATKRRPLLYLPRSLPIVDIAKQFLSPRQCHIAGECQALNTIISKDIATDLILETDSGEYVHKRGYYVANFFLSDDFISKTDTGRSRAEMFFDTFRARPKESHQWLGKSSKGFLPPCIKFEQTFDLCGGCPYKGHITSPNQISPERQLTIEQVGEPIKANTLEEIRATVFPQLQNRIIELIRESKKGLLCLNTPRNSGKSTQADQIIYELAMHAGIRSVISVPKGQLAMEHMARLQAKGLRVLPLFGFDNSFEFISRFKCPNESAIKRSLLLGADRRTVRNTYCKKCEYVDECHYINQFNQLRDAPYDVVIIQHSHFGLKHLGPLLQSLGYSLLWMDESILKNLAQELQIKQAEWDILSHLENQMPWIKDFKSWFLGLGTKPHMSIKQDDLIYLYEIFVRAGIEWRISDFLQMWYAGEYYDVSRGVLKISWPPDLPLKVLMDATARIPVIKRVFGDDVEVIGSGLYVDIRHYHPDNKIILVPDVSVGVGAMHDPAHLDQLLRFVGKRIVDRYLGRRVLIIAYKDQIELIRTFLQIEFPQIDQSLLDIHQMTQGENRWEHFEVQFVLAWHYPSGVEFAKQKYFLERLESYAANTTRSQLFYPRFAIESDSIPRAAKQQPLKVNILKSDGFVYPCELEEVLVDVPADGVYDAEIEKMAMADNEQTGRLRLKPGELRHEYRFGKQNLPNMAITNLMFAHQVFSK